TTTLAAGISYDQLEREHVWAPLMAHTAIALTPWMKQHLALGHDPQGTVAPNWDIPALAGAGAIRQLRLASHSLRSRGLRARTLSITILFSRRALSGWCADRRWRLHLAADGSAVGDGEPRRDEIADERSGRLDVDLLRNGHVAGDGAHDHERFRRDL